MKFSKYLSITVLGTALILTGCNDLKKNDVVKPALENSKLQVECELDIDAFSHILEKNISYDDGPIDCLDKTLDLFISVVESGRPGSLSRVALENFLLKNRNDFSEEDIKMVKAVFDINHLIFGDHPDYISKENKDKIVKLAKVFNKEASKNYELFESKQEVAFAVHKDVHLNRISISANIIAKELLSIFNPNRNGEVHRLDIIKLLESFTTESSRDTIEKAKKLLFAKRVLVGGFSEEITHEEFYRLSYSLPKLILVAFDLIRFKYVDIDQKSVLALFNNDLKYVEEIVFSNTLPNRDKETLFEMDELMDGLKVLLDPEDFNTVTYDSLVREVKTLIMDGSPDRVKGEDLKKLIAHGKEILGKGLVFHQVYEYYRDTLISREKVVIPASEIEVKFPTFKKEHLRDFSRIIEKYRFFKGNFNSAYFSDFYYRNANGVTEIALLEYVIQIVAKKYGRATPGALGGYSFDLEDINNLLNKFQEFLYAEEIVLPGRNAKTADTVTLMGSLFQYQSDENKFLDVNELVEFGMSLLTGSSIGEDLLTEVKKKCGNDKYDRVESTCARKNFFQAFCKTSGVYYPRLLSWLKIDVNKCDQYQPSEEAMAYLMTAEKASRTCMNYSDGAKEEIPYSQSDMMTLFTAVLNIEATMIRYDKNQNNIMDKNELDDAYKIYGPAIEGFINKMTGIELIVARQLKREIFLYLIKFEKIPEGVDLLKFVAFDFKKKAPANRKTIASILVNIGSQGAVDNFQCKWLRTPKHIPRTPEEQQDWTPDLGDDWQPPIDTDK